MSGMTFSRMDSTTLLRGARLEDALVALKEEVRSAPLEVDLRVRMFALHCVLGRWEKAIADLDVVRQLDKTWTLPAQSYRGLMGAEALRREVFSGRAKPLIMGEPAPWVGWHVEALAMEAAGNVAEARDLQQKAWEAAPACAASIEGRTVQCLSDMDRRIGTILEVVIEGKYYWIPYEHLQRIEFTPPEFLIDAVWLPAKLTVRAGAELVAHLPARYPGTEEHEDGRVCLGQSTVWKEIRDGMARPFGQKMFESDHDEFALLACRLIEFTAGA